MRVHQFRCSPRAAPGAERARVDAESCRCLLIEIAGELILVDTGADCRPDIECGPAKTAEYHVRRLGFWPHEVDHILINDHLDGAGTSGLGEFPCATVHGCTPSGASKNEPEPTVGGRHAPPRLR
ncbi:hypothetical protein [Rhodococcus sp. NPDC049939]|uniref:hypothetical protein n=1 Tax=Rhodococcus sp. NPDC049939 TaxID=3155511 RepID=UPI0033ED9955